MNRSLKDMLDNIDLSTEPWGSPEATMQRCSDKKVTRMPKCDFYTVTFHKLYARLGFVLCGLFYTKPWISPNAGKLKP